MSIFCGRSLTPPSPAGTLWRFNGGSSSPVDPTTNDSPGPQPLQTMPHPKRRTSKARKGVRRSHLAIKPEALQRDPRSGALTRPHRVNEKEATHYGFDKGGQGGYQVFEREDF